MKKKISILSTAEIDIDDSNEWLPDEVSLTIVPFVHIVYSKDEQLRLNVNSIAKNNAKVVFTSKHGVRAVFELLDTKSVDWTIFCLGQFTHKSVEECFPNCTVTMLGNSASELAMLLIEKGINEVVFFSGDKRLDTLPTLLTDAGVAVNEVVVYSNMECSSKIEQNFDGILFCSPSAVHSFFSSNTVGSNTVLFAIGETTAAAIYKYTSENVVGNRVSGKVELLNKAIQYLT